MHGRHSNIYASKLSIARFRIDQSTNLLAVITGIRVYNLSQLLNSLLDYSKLTGRGFKENLVALERFHFGHETISRAKKMCL